MELKEEYEGVDWIQLTQDRSVSPPADMVINFRLHKFGEYFMS
jgi:hypothetical protein